MNKAKLIFSLAAISVLSACSFIPSRSAAESTSLSLSSIENPLTKTVLQRTYQDYSENSVYLKSSIPMYGSPKVLVIPVWFTNSSSYINSTSGKSNVLADIKTAFEGTQSEVGWHSVKTYYETLSQGSLSLTFTYSDWYECDYSSQYMGSSDYGQTRTVDLVSEATDWFFEQNPNEYRTDYDYNNDGYIDGVMLIYGAPDYASLEDYYGNYSNLWAYCYWLQKGDANRNSPNPNCFFWSSYDFMYDERTAFIRTGHTYGYGDCSNASIDTHTFIHETGHCLGYDADYYDYSGQYSPAGGFSMQDQNVGGHDPYSVMASGWADPYIPTEDCSITIGAFQSTHDLILLTPEWNDSDSPFDEYLLLELYTPTGLNEFDCSNRYSGAYPSGPSATGLRVWHVDARLTTTSGRTFSTELFTDPLSPVNGAQIAMSNSYSGDHVSVLGNSYLYFNQLQLIRNDTTSTHRNGNYISNSDLFRDRSTFTMSKFDAQFYRNGRMNSGAELGWSFSVSIEGSGATATATIDLYRE